MKLLPKKEDKTDVQHVAAAQGWPAWTKGETLTCHGISFTLERIDLEARRIGVSYKDGAPVTVGQVTRLTFKGVTWDVATVGDEKVHLWLFRPSKAKGIRAMMDRIGGTK